MRLVSISNFIAGFVSCCFCFEFFFVRQLVHRCVITKIFPRSPTFLLLRLGSFSVKFFHIICLYMRPLAAFLTLIGRLYFCIVLVPVLFLP